LRVSEIPGLKEQIGHDIITASTLTFRQHGFPYTVRCATGSFARAADGRRIRMVPRQDRLVLDLASHPAAH